MGMFSFCALRFFDEVGTAGTLEHQVDECDVGLELDERRQRGVGVVNFAAHLEVGLLLDELCESAAHDGMVVDDQYPDCA